MNRSDSGIVLEFHEFKIHLNEHFNPSAHERRKPNRDGKDKITLPDDLPVKTTILDKGALFAYSLLSMLTARTRLIGNLPSKMQGINLSRL